MPRTVRNMLAAGVLLLGACRDEPLVPSSRPVRLFRDLTIGERLSRAYASSMRAVEVQLVGTPGSSLLTVEALQQGRADAGFALADVVYLAHREPHISGGESTGTLRGIAALNVTPLHLVTRAGLKIKTVREMRGLRMRTGPLPTGTAALSDLVFNAFGVRSDEILKTPSTAPLPDELARGTTDAAFVTAYYPSPMVNEVARHGAQLVPIEGPAVDDLIRAYPFLKTVTIPAGTYPSQDRAIRTIGVDFLFICRSDLDASVVYELTKHFIAALPQLASDLGTSLQQMDIDRASATPIPLHRGAAQYYREWELAR